MENNYKVVCNYQISNWILYLTDLFSRIYNFESNFWFTQRLKGLALMALSGQDLTTF